MSLRRLRVNGYEGARPDVQAVVPIDATRILELRCSTRRVGAAIKARQHVRITGVELDELYAEDAKASIDRAIRSSAEGFMAEPAPDSAYFDCLIAADVLEHLVDPWDVLSKSVSMLAPGATVVVSVPNVLYWPQLRRLFTEHRWPRDDAGIFDRTHLRWFTRSDAIELIEQAGLDLVRVVPGYWARGPRLVVSATRESDDIRLAGRCSPGFCSAPDRALSPMPRVTGAHESHAVVVELRSSRERSPLSWRPAHSRSLAVPPLRPGPTTPRTCTVRPRYRRRQPG